MADEPKTIGKTDVQYAQDYLNIQQELANAYKSQENSLLSHAKIQKTLSRNIIENLSRTQDLNKLVQKSYSVEQRLQRELLREKNETKREEIRDAIDGVLLRRKGYEQELALLGKIRTQGWIPIIWAAHRVWSLFTTLDSAAWKFRETMGLTRDTSQQIRKSVEGIYLDTMHLGVAIGGVYDAWMAVGKEMGSVHIVNKDLVRTTAILKSQLGVAEENSAGLMRMMASISGTTMKTQENMAYTTTLMAQAAGIPLNVVMNDIGKASGHTLTMMSRLPGQVIKAAVELRRMGTSLKESSNASREILNFTDSIQAEMEASVLLGRSINLQHARELAYRRDIEGSTKEILRITKQIDFANLDVFQQEAFARATGRSVDELYRMLQADKEWAAARRSTDPELRKMVERYEELRRANKATVLSETERLKIMVQTKANQERIASITAKWNQLINKVAAIFLPAIDRVLGFVVDNFETIVASAAGLLTFGHRIGDLFLKLGGWLGKWGRPLTWIGTQFNKIGGYVRTILNFFPKIQAFLGIFQKIGDKIISLFAKLGPAFSWIGRHLGQIGGWVGRLLPSLSSVGGWILKVGKFIGTKVAVPLILVLNIMKRFVDGWYEIQNMGYFAGVWHMFKKIGLAIWDTFNDFFIGLPGLIVKGLKAGWNWIVDALTGPFQTAWNWIKGLWGGKSPSQVGLSILKGIVAIGPMLFDALTAPFRKGLAWIADKIPGMSKVASKLRGGAAEIIGTPVENRIATTYVPAVTVTPTGTKIAGATAPTAAATTAEAESTFATDKTLQEILTAINTLNSNLSSGKIGIYLDGQLVSATLARQTEFRGGYGVNRH